ncbi:MAG TPA: hypothetical protein VHX36_12915 [Candidatus Acidoferrales bacterium]|jgi:hypothetical protein|nr:hypothetical protein [Candidatus Acidoferrales bacterium]
MTTSLIYCVATALTISSAFVPIAKAADGTSTVGAGHVQPGTPALKSSTQPETAALESELAELRDVLATQEERIAALESELEIIKAKGGASGIVSAAAAPSEPAPTPPDTGPAVIPAIAPMRALPVGGIQRESLKPAFTIGSVRVTPYGFIKATFIHDSSSPGGDDFPLPGFITDTGPTASPEFHVKARSTRLGTNFEWIDPSEKITLTGKIEVDFEGNFTRADNRNLSSIRSSTPSIRLAYGRLDYKAGDHDTLSALFGQDWTPFGSSTLPGILETTGLGVGFGGLWERDPQMRFGWTHDFGAFKLMPEFALVLPASGNVPSATNLASELGYGERQGADSDQPSTQARLVFQWQLDHAPGVVPAQIIFSGEEGRREAIVLGSAVPAAFAVAFPRGATVSSPTAGWSGEWQLPTRFATLFGKYYQGSDLRWFFGGQLYSNFNDTAGLTGTASALSIDGSSTVVFGMRNGVPVVAPQRPVRAAGGFTSLGLPISRILGADPHGRNMGWTMYFTYGTDEAKTSDLLHLAPAGSRARSDMSVGTIYYKLNTWVSFAYEQSLYRTRADTAASGLPLFMGEPQHEWKDFRSEGGTIFTF